MRLPVVLSQALRIRRQLRLIEEQEACIDRLTARLRTMHADVDLLGACLPVEKRMFALALIRDRHRIETGDIVEEAEL